MKTLYLDCFSGISGNMFIGALIDLGVDPTPFLESLSVYDLKDDEIILEKTERKGVSATYFNLTSEDENLHDKHHHKHEYHHRSLKDVEMMIDRAALEDNVKQTAKAIFKHLAKGEAKIHGKNIEDIHFHEVGELDSIIDVLGASYLLHELKVDRVICSQINPGSGEVQCAHGLYPVPAPATLEILSSVQAPLGGPVVNAELTTPTGAAVVAEIVDEFSPVPKGRVLAAGYGAGSRHLTIPNVLRVLLLDEEVEAEHLWFSFNVDDMNGEELGFLMDKLKDMGARDVSFTPIYMKKNRPAYRVDVIADIKHEEILKETIFVETSTLGIKKIPFHKVEFNRSFQTIDLDGYSFTEKKSIYQNMEKSSFEYEEVKAYAKAEGLSLRSAFQRLNHLRMSRYES